MQFHRAVLLWLWITQVQQVQVCDVYIKVCSESSRILDINTSTETIDNIKIAHEIRIFKFSKWREGSSRAIQTAIMDTQFSLNNYTSKLPHLVKLCFLPVYSQSCDASGSRVHGDILGDTTWPV